MPRENFAGPGPWAVQIPGRNYVETPTDDLAFLYQDTLVGIDPARGINMGEPSLHARCLDALRIQLGETVLHVGAGVGYYTALLAYLVGETGRVHAIEIEHDLAIRAASNVAQLRWVEVACRSGLGPELPEADVIYVNAGLPIIPEAWLRALRPGGRLMFPFQPLRGLGCMLRIERPANGNIWTARFVSRASFIGCAGAQEEAPGRRLAEAFRAGKWEDVRSLRFNADKGPDASCWLQGDDWWLSTSGPGEPILLRSA